MYQYPYGNAQQLNLDWILSKLQELEAETTQVNIEEVANALISASFNAGVSYRRYDYCFYNGKLYRALNDTTGAFNPADWLEVVIGDDIPVLTRLLNAVDTSLTTLQGQVADLDSDDVDNASNVTGTTVTDALDNLNGALPNKLSLSLTDTSVIPDGTDYDTLTTTGQYYCAGSSNAQTMINCPVTVGHRLIVMAENSNARTVQILFSNNSVNAVYFRVYLSTGWAKWVNSIKLLTSLFIGNNKSASNVNIGEYLTDGHAFYRAISAISSGDTITENTNVVETTVADELSLLRKNSVVDPFNIQSNSDLNDLTQLGFYSCSTAAIASSLSHCPTTTAFSLIVMKKGNYYNQFLTTGGNFYGRTQTSGGWGHWLQATVTDTGA